MNGGDTVSAAGTLSAGVEAAMREAAARAIMPRFRRLSSADVHEKTAGEAVTIADRHSEEILSDHLAVLLPEAAIVGEEAAHHDPALLATLGGPLCWIIDPLDGTGNFANGTAPFGILVALAAGGETIGGWILDPLSGRFCATERGRGAAIDGEPVRADTSETGSPILAVTKLFADPARRAVLITRLAPHYRIVDSPRCAADQYPRVAEGIHHLTLFERTIAWDHAAGALFVNEAGGQAARIDGTPYRVDDQRSGMIVATSPALWDGLAGAIAMAGLAPA